MAHYRAIIQVAESQITLHEAALRNVRNIAADLGAAGTLAVVAHGEGIGLVTGDTGFEQEVGELIKQGVHVLACRNTLKRKQIPEERLLPAVEIVISGLGEIIRRQHDGWAYVRP